MDILSCRLQRLPLILPSSVKSPRFPFQSLPFSWRSLLNPERRASPGSRLFSPRMLRHAEYEGRARATARTMALQTAKRPGGPGLPHLQPGTKGIAAPLLPAPAWELHPSHILAAPLGVWVPRAPTRNGTTNALAPTWDSR